MNDCYVVIVYIQGKYITALVEAPSELEARWKGLLKVTERGYETKDIGTPTVHKIDVNDVVFNPSKREGETKNDR